MTAIIPSSDPIAPSPYPIAADDRLRRKPQISYEVSSGSDDELARSSSPESSFTSPEQPSKHRRSLVDLVDGDDELEEIMAPPTKRTSTGHQLREHKDTDILIRAQENADRPRKKMRFLGKAPPILKLGSQRLPTKPQTERMEIRREIATETARKRANFFVAKKHLLLPLLPEDSNFVKKMVDQRRLIGNEHEDLTLPYQAIESQPSGIKATMKPYQLLGLSFLVYMHGNGLSGILGDEMGLGKTLQTLSLFQYLKNDVNSSSKHRLRPSLVVCPLSVLSSWMAESRRWTPELKVIRFHGPVHERNRLKQIVSGEIDQYGHQTLNAKKKANARRFAKGQQIIDLETDDDKDDERRVDVVVTTYDGFLAEQAWFKRVFVWNYVVLDEGHKIKNDTTLIAKALQGLGAEYRLILTGTPLQNNLLELWALLHWLYPEVFTERTADLFRSSFDLTRGQVNTKIMDHSRQLLEEIMLRRMKNSPGVDLNLPPKTDVLLYVPLTPMQRFYYKKLLTRSDEGLLNELFQDASSKEAALSANESFTKIDQEAVAKLESLEKQAAEGSAKSNMEWEETKDIMRQAFSREQVDEKAKGSWRKLMNILMQLRKCCNHPYTLPHTEPDPYYIGDHVIKASGKFILLDKIINELVLKQKRKIIIFSGFVRMLDCCEDFLALRGGQGDDFSYVRLDGQTSRARRNLNIRMFNDESSNYRVILISTRAGGLGINLATASDVILLDSDWNPQIMLQAEARSHRIGQKNPVTIYKLCTQGTVEEQMMGRIQKKLYLSAKVTESMRDIHFNSAPKTKKGPGGRIIESEEDMPQLGTTELMSLVRRGAQTLAHPEIDVNEMMGWDFSKMLEQCKDKPLDHLVADPSGNSVREDDEKRWLSQIEQVQSRLFEGKRHNKSAELNSYGNIAQEWTRESRRVGKETTVMVDGFAVSKESMSCGDWEAVPTMAGKDPRLAEAKREKRAKIMNQEVRLLLIFLPVLLLIHSQHCQVCWDGGNMILCSGCPRSYHYQCLDKDAQLRSKAKINFSCPQHQCHDCSQKTSDAGGMLFRCRWCERAFCEDCLDWDTVNILNNNLKEYELLGFPPVDQAWYIKCPRCIEDHKASPGDLELCNNAAKEIEEKYNDFLEERVTSAAAEEEVRKVAAIPSRDESLTDGTTLNSSGVTTPGLKGLEQSAIMAQDRGRKSTRKSLASSIGSTPVSMRSNDSTGPDRRPRQAAPKNFTNELEITTLSSDDSVEFPTSISRKRQGDKTLSRTPVKRPKHLTT